LLLPQETSGRGCSLTSQSSLFGDLKPLGDKNDEHKTGKGEGEGRLKDTRYFQPHWIKLD
jgi:hypothetical protein